MDLDDDMINFVDSGGEEFRKAVDKVIDNTEQQELVKKTIEESKQLKTVTIPINRHGSCPNCNTSWDGGDILEELSRMDVFQHRSRAEMLKIAAEYGYDEENKKRFSTIIMVEITPSLTFSDLQLTQLGTGISIQVPLSYYQCPSCHHVFDTKTGKHFSSLNEARNSVYE